MAKQSIGFIWQGVSDTKIFNHWNDGLRAAMRILEKEYDVHYKEPWDEINEDIILYWEAPITYQGKNAPHYNRVRNLPQKKILLFAGGRIEKEWVKGFDLLAVESAINEKECEQMGIPYIRAFGVNTEIFKPMNLPKIYQGIHHGTCASWKRQNLLCNALKDGALVVGRDQPSDPQMFLDCQKTSVVMDEKSAEEVARLINQSNVLVQTSDYYGGGQRATLEAMACGVNVIVMSDSPKNREFVEESGFGIVCEPNEEAIRKSVSDIIQNSPNYEIGVNYVRSKWTEQHYANNLKKAIQSL